MRAKTQRSVPIEEMGITDNLILGRKYWKPQEIVSWNPDHQSNYNILITGTSGSGKTTLLKEVIKYLENQNKVIHVLDIKGDVTTGLPSENNLVFKTRASEIGISAFEFIFDVDHGGPRTQAIEIVEMMKRSFLPGMGGLQKGVLLQIILDLYKIHGFIDDDPTTWGMDLPKEEFSKRLPTIADMEEFVIGVMELVSEGADSDFMKYLKKVGKQAVKHKSKISQLNRSIEEVKLAPEDYDSDKLDELYEKKKAIENEVALLKDTFMEKSEEAFEYFYDNGANPFNQALRDANKEKKYKDLDLKYYSKSSTMAVLGSLQTHLKTLVISGVFSGNTPNVIAGVNRYYIKDLSQSVQVFFVDAIVRKIFRAVRNRGDYHKLSEEYKQKRGRLCDHFIVIDEAQVIAPTGKDAKDPTSGLNRVVSEARGYGLGLILLTQTAANLSEHIRKNTATKIILRTEKSDIPVVKKMLDIETRDFETIGTHFGTGLLKSENGKIEPIVFPWSPLADDD